MLNSTKPLTENLCAISVQQFSVWRNCKTYAAQTLFESCKIPNDELRLRHSIKVE